MERDPSSHIRGKEQIIGDNNTTYCQLKLDGFCGKTPTFLHTPSPLAIADFFGFNTTQAEPFHFVARIEKEKAKK